MIPDGHAGIEISIHALREEGDILSLANSARPPVFLSTPSARRATSLRRMLRGRRGISIHALREEGDTVMQYQSMPSP